MGKAKVIFSGVAWTIINNIASILYGIISIPFLINYFGKEEYGLIGIALSVNVYIQLLDMGMTNSNVRFFSEFIAKKEKGNIQKLFSLTHLFYLVLGILNSIILFGLSFIVEDLFKVTPEQTITLRNLLWILALNATFSWISTCFDQFLRAHELINWIKKRSFLLKLMQFIILAITIIFSQTIEFYFFGYILLTTLIFPLTIIKTKKIAPEIKLNFQFDKDIFKTIFPYAISIFSFSIFQFLAMNTRSLVLGNISGPGAVAEFSIMNTVSSVISTLSGSFMQVLLPIITKMSISFDWKGINMIMNNGTKYVNIFLSFIIFILIVSVEELFTLYVGLEYTKLSNWMIIWLITLLLGHRNIMTSLVFTEKKLKSVAIMGGLAMIMAIIAYLIFVPIYGVGGVVIGFTIHELTHTIFYYSYFLPKKFQIDSRSIFFKSIFPTWIILGGTCFTVRYLLKDIHCSIFISAISKMTVLALLMIMLIWFILLNKEDKKIILKFLMIRNR